MGDFPETAHARRIRDEFDLWANISTHKWLLKARTRDPVSDLHATEEPLPDVCPGDAPRGGRAQAPALGRGKAGTPDTARRSVALAAATGSAKGGRAPYRDGSSQPEPEPTRGRPEPEGHRHPRGPPGHRRRLGASQMIVTKRQLSVAQPGSQREAPCERAVGTASWPCASRAGGSFWKGRNDLHWGGAARSPWAVPAGLGMVRAGHQG